eukprot:712287-Rhodomonas_salina.4
MIPNATDIAEGTAGQTLASPAPYTISVPPIVWSICRHITKGAWVLERANCGIRLGCVQADSGTGLLEEVPFPAQVSDQTLDLFPQLAAIDFGFDGADHVVGASDRATQLGAHRGWTSGVWCVRDTTCIEMKECDRTRICVVGHDARIGG